MDRSSEIWDAKEFEFDFEVFVTMYEHKCDYTTAESMVITERKMNKENNNG